MVAWCWEGCPSKCCSAWEAAEPNVLLMVADPVAHVETIWYLEALAEKGRGLGGGEYRGGSRAGEEQPVESLVFHPLKLWGGEAASIGIVQRIWNSRVTPRL